MNKAYAIFDMDGTLIDSMDYWQNLGREYLISNGVTENIDFIEREIEQMTMSESAELFVRRFLPHKKVEQVVIELNEKINEHYRNDIPRKANVQRYLERLKQKGVSMCVASATEPSLLNECLKRLELLQYFDFTLSCETIGKSKTEPDIYIEATRRYGTTPEQTAVFEDARYAIQTAKKVGFYTVGVYDRQPQKEWESICKLADEIIVWERSNYEENSISNRRK